MANAHGFTDEEMAALSDEERAALEEDESAAPDTPAAEAAEADPAPPDPDPAASATPPETPPAGDEPAEEPPAPTEPPVASEPAPEPEPEPEPAAATPAAEPAPTEPRDFTQELHTLDEQELAVAKRFDEGEISHMEAKREEIQLRSLRDNVTAARDHERAVASSADAMWNHELKVFHADHKEYTGNDLAARSRQAALGQAVQDLSTPENLRTRTHAWFLQEAHKQVDVVFGVTKVPDVPAAAAGPGDVPANTSETKPGEAPPKTLGGLPAAADDDPSADEFSALDKLTGMELEQALNKLTPAQADAYLDTSKLHH